MKLTFSKIYSFLRKRLSTIDLKVYLICVIIASFIWLLMILSDNFTDEIEFPVNYVNYPEGMVLVSKPAKYITAQVKSKGYEIASASLSYKNNVNIDLSKLRLKRSAYGRYVAAIPTSKFRYNIISQLKVDDVGKSFRPDSIYFVFDSLKTKKLKVSLNSNIKYANGYTQYGNPTISPAFVIAEGPAFNLKKINCVKTDSLILSDVKRDINQTVRLQSMGGLIKLNKNEVDVSFRVEKFSEFSVSVPVTVVSNVPDLKVKTFPSMVKVTCSMALPDYKMLSDTSFEVTARLDSLDLLNENKVILNITKKPINAKSISLSDESIEYVLIK